MKIVGPTLDRATECEAILRSLPNWFGIEDSLRSYVSDSLTMPGFGFEANATLNGFILLKEHFPRAWEVHCIAVLATERGKGIGSRLLDHAESWLSSQGARILQIKTIADTSPDPHYAETRDFYLKKGYVPVEVFPDLWGKTNPALQLMKSLESTKK